jgi:hypothetical protein
VSHPTPTHPSRQAETEQRPDLEALLERAIDRFWELRYGFSCTQESARLTTLDEMLDSPEGVAIVRACNSHDALVKACEAAYAWLDRFGEHAPLVFGGEAEVADQIRAALALARGEGSGK